MPKRSAFVSKPSHFWFNRSYPKPSASLQLQLNTIMATSSVLRFNIVLFHFIFVTTLLSTNLSQNFKRSVH